MNDEWMEGGRDIREEGSIVWTLGPSAAQWPPPTSVIFGGIYRHHRTSLRFWLLPFPQACVLYASCSKLYALQAVCSVCRRCSLNTPQEWPTKTIVTASGTGSAPLTLPSTEASNSSPTLRKPETGLAWETGSATAWELA